MNYISDYESGGDYESEEDDAEITMKEIEEDLQEIEESFFQPCGPPSTPEIRQPLLSTSTPPTFAESTRIPLHQDPSLSSPDISTGVQHHDRPPLSPAEPVPGTSTGVRHHDRPPRRNFWGESDESDVQLTASGRPLRSCTQLSQSSSLSLSSNKVQCHICLRFYGKAYLKKHIATVHKCQNT